jgi:Eukaryotic translation initiation factor 3 subunit 8 N-terminus
VVPLPPGAPPVPFHQSPVERAAALQVLMQLGSTLFDLSSNLNTSIPVHVWQRAARALVAIMALLKEHPHIIVDENLERSPERTEEPPAEEDVRVTGNLRAFVERLDDELFKILQARDCFDVLSSLCLLLSPVRIRRANRRRAVHDHASAPTPAYLARSLVCAICRTHQAWSKRKHPHCYVLLVMMQIRVPLQMTDSHTTEYIARLREEPILLALAEQVAQYLGRIGDHAGRAFIALRQAEHFYYKTAAVYSAMRSLIETTKAREAEVRADALVVICAQVGLRGSVRRDAVADRDDDSRGGGGPSRLPFAVLRGGVRRRAAIACIRALPTLATPALRALPTLATPAFL